MNPRLFALTTADWLHRCVPRSMGTLPMPPRQIPDLPQDKTDLSTRAAYFAQSAATRAGVVAEIELPA